MKRRRPLRWIAAGLVAGYLAFGLWVLSRRAERVPPSPGEARGAWHVHTTRSDGRGSLDEVVAAARAAGLQFVVITDHNVMSPADAGYRGGVLVIQASEISAPYGHGHIVGLGISRELTKEERRRDALGHIEALGGSAVLAHPFHPKRSFTRWEKRNWLGFEIVSNDTFWAQARRPASWWRLALGVLALPWDAAQSMVFIAHYPEEELRHYDATLREGRRHPLFCSNDAHGWPTYRAAFETFSMHVPVALTGDAAADIPAVVQALRDGSGSCVFDGVAPASRVRLSLEPGRDRLALALDAPRSAPTRYRLLKDGAPYAEAAGPGDDGRVTFSCPGGTCPPGAYRVEAEWDGRPWIYTNPLHLD